MSNTIIKSFTTLEIVNISAFLEDIIATKKIDELSMKFRWAIKKSIKSFADISDEFNKMRTEFEDELRSNYLLNEEKSEPTKVQSKNELGVIEEVDGRKVKDEFLSEYTDAVNEINRKLGEIAGETNEVSVSVLDVGAEIEKLGDDTRFTFDDLVMLEVFDRGDAD